MIYLYTDLCLFPLSQKNQRQGFYNLLERTDSLYPIQLWQPALEPLIHWAQDYICNTHVQCFPPKTYFVSQGVFGLFVKPKPYFLPWAPFSFSFTGKPHKLSWHYPPSPLCVICVGTFTFTPNVSNNPQYIHNHMLVSNIKKLSVR